MKTFGCHFRKGDPKVSGRWWFFNEKLIRKEPSQEWGPDPKMWPWSRQARKLSFLNRKLIGKGPSQEGRPRSQNLALKPPGPEMVASQYEVIRKRAIPGETAQIPDGTPGPPNDTQTGSKGRRGHPVKGQEDIKGKTAAEWRRRHARSPQPAHKKEAQEE